MSDEAVSSTRHVLILPKRENLIYRNYFVLCLKFIRDAISVVISKSPDFKYQNYFVKRVKGRYAFFFPYLIWKSEMFGEITKYIRPLFGKRTCGANRQVWKKVYSRRVSLTRSLPGCIRAALRLCARRRGVAHPFLSAPSHGNAG